MADYISREAAVKIATKYGLANGSVLGRHTWLADCIAIEIEGLPAAAAQKWIWRFRELDVKHDSLVLSILFALLLCYLASRFDRLSWVRAVTHTVPPGWLRAWLLGNVQVKPRVTLRPFRTFLEVAQPESEFILRLNDRGEINLIGADGGAWKLEAVRNIAAYFEEKLGDMVEAGRVVVLR